MNQATISMNHVSTTSTKVIIANHFLQNYYQVSQTFTKTMNGKSCNSIDGGKILYSLSCLKHVKNRQVEASHLFLPPSSTILSSSSFIRRNRSSSPMTLYYGGLPIVHVLNTSVLISIYSGIKKVQSFMSCSLSQFNFFVKTIPKSIIKLRNNDCITINRI